MGIFRGLSSRRRKYGAFAPLGLALACLSLGLAGCGPEKSEGVLKLEAEPALMPRLEALVASYPPPSGWSLAQAGDTPDATLRLIALGEAEALPAGSALCGELYLAASTDLATNLYSVSSAGAEELGLSSLDSIELPRRALAVDGLLPGRPGYPFEQRLVLALRPEGEGRLPRGLAQWVKKTAASAAARETRPLDLAAVGDIQVGEYQWPLLATGEEGLSSLLVGGVLDLLRKPDLAVANLESPVSARGYPNPRKRFHFRMPPGSGAALHAAGLDLLLLANNHGLDYGLDAFEDSLADLGSASMAFVGAGENLDEASAARFLDARGGEALAFVGYGFFPDELGGFTRSEAAASASGPGIAADEGSTLASIRSAAATGAAVVVLAHGGAEYVPSPTAAARALFARFVDAGAALVVGSHPHLLQGCEARSGSLIAYSLGNFLFTGEAEPPAAQSSAVLDFLFYRGKVRGLGIHPITAGYYYTSLDQGQSEAEARFSALNAALLGR